LQRLLSQVSYVSTDLKPLQLYTNNLPALNIIRKDSYHKRIKHINSYFKYTKQQYKDSNISINYLPSVNMLANSLTKLLNKLEHTKFISLINIVNVPCI
jgi:uncharacterized protein YlbG (UPF0298 family)